MDNVQELMYKALIVKAVQLQEEGRTMKCSEVVDWINSNFKFPHPYVSARGVLKAAHNRAQTQPEIIALETVFTDRNGNALL